MFQKPKVLIFGIDGASFHLMNFLIEEGCLPHFSEFSKRAHFSPLRCTWPPHTATGWPTIFSGQLPGEHGIFQFWDCQARDYKLRVTGSQALRCKSMWEVIMEKGWRSGLINIPMSHPPSDLPAYIISWPLTATIHFSKPRGLLKEILNVGGHALPDIACMYDGSADYPMRAVKYIKDRTKSLCYLLDKYPVEAVSIVYTELDRVCHHYWHALDKNHPLYSNTSATDRNVIVDIFQEIDNAFGEIISFLDDDCCVLVISDHGFGPSTRGVRLHNLLQEGGFCQFNHRSEKNLQNQELNSKSHYLDSMDWNHTNAYLSVPGSFGININLETRQKFGRVKILDKLKIQNELTEFLADLKDESGYRIFEAIVPSVKAYQGKFFFEAPDLLLIPHDPSVNILDGCGGSTWTTSGQTGSHRIDGVFMMSAPGIEPVQENEHFPIESVANYLLTAIGITSGELPLQDTDASFNMQKAGIPKYAWSSMTDNTEFNIKSQQKKNTILPLPDIATSKAPKNDSEVLERLRALGYME